MKTFAQLIALLAVGLIVTGCGDSPSSAPTDVSPTPTGVTSKAPPSVPSEPDPGAPPRAVPPPKDVAIQQDATQRDTTKHVAAEQRGNQPGATPRDASQGEAAQKAASPPDGPVRRRVSEAFSVVPEQLPPLDNPVLRSRENADHMRPTDVVFGVLLGGQARAYPWWVAKNYHVINDEVGGQPLLITFCEQCSTTAAFSRIVRGRPLTWYLLGMDKGTLSISDRDTQTLWAPYDGVAVEGQLKGEKLERIPLFHTNWEDWQQRHPNTDVVWDHQKNRLGHGAWYTPGKWGIVCDVGETVTNWDTRLPENDWVFGVLAGESHKAYDRITVQQAGGLVNDVFEKTPVVVLASGDFDMISFHRTVADQVLTFEAAASANAFMRDLETGSRWTAEGRAVDGPLNGKELTPTDGFLAEWHVWFDRHPTTELFLDRKIEPVDELIFPELNLTRIDQRGAVRLENTANVVISWAKWCPPCEIEMPKLQQLADKYADRPVTFASIAVQMPADDEYELQKYLVDKKLRLPVFLTTDRFQTELDRICMARFGHGGVFPMAFVLDSNRNVLEILKHDAFDRLPQRIDEVLAAAAVTGSAAPAP